MESGGRANHEAVVCQEWPRARRRPPLSEILEHCCAFRARERSPAPRAFSSGLDPAHVKEMRSLGEESRIRATGTALGAAPWRPVVLGDPPAPLTPDEDPGHAVGHW